MSDVMQFGKHKGKDMGDIPLEYLLWCAREMKKCPMMVMQEIDRRVGLDGVSGRSADKYRKIRATGGLTPMGAFVGSDYQRLRDEFDRADGDADKCPFNTTDYTYTGPSISWVGGQPVIVPSEFPVEVVRYED